MMALTVGDLRTRIADLPDDMEVVVIVGEYSCQRNLEQPVIDCFEESGHPNVLLLAGEPDKDENGALL